MSEKAGWAATGLATVVALGSMGDAYFDRERARMEKAETRALIEEKDDAEMRCIQVFVAHIADDAKRRNQ